MKLNRDTEALKVGDLVTSEYDYERRDVVRRLTSIANSDNYESGRCASADAGEPCPTCHAHPARAIIRVDSAWFIPAKKEKRDG